MSNLNSILLDDLSESRGTLDRSQAILAIADSMLGEFVSNETTHTGAYLALRHLLIASHHLTANAIADINVMVFILKNRQKDVPSHVDASVSS